MSNKENNFKEHFKQALISTSKVISDDYKLDIKKLHFRSKKFVIEGDNIHPGKAAYEKNVKIESFSASPVPIIDCPSFWEEMDFFWITESV